MQSVLVYASETWATKVEDIQRMERAERMMIRWMCKVTLKDRIHMDELRQRLGVDSVIEVARQGRLRWFGHVERKSREDYVSACRELEVKGTRRRGRGRKTWMDCVSEDMKKTGLKKEDAQNRSTWRAGTMRNRLTRASMEK